MIELKRFATQASTQAVRALITGRGTNPLALGPSTGLGAFIGKSHAAEQSPIAAKILVAPAGTSASEPFHCRPRGAEGR